MKVGDFVLEMSLKGTEKIGESLEAARKGLKGAASDALTAEKKVGDLGGALQKLAGIGGASLSIGAISKMGSELGRSLHTASLYTGDSVKAFQELARSMAISIPQSISFMERMSDLRGQLMLHGGQDLWGSLGIDLSKIHNGQEMAEALRKAGLNSGKFGANTRLILNEALRGAGLSPDDIGKLLDVNGPLFPKSSRDITDQQAAQADKISKGWTGLENKLDQLQTKFADVFGDDLIDALNDFADAALGFVKFVGTFEKNHPDAKKIIGQQGAAVAAGGIGGTIGSIIGGILGIPGGVPGILAGIAAGGTWGGGIGLAGGEGAIGLKNAKDAGYFTKAEAWTRSLVDSFNAGARSQNQTLQATINTTVNVPGMPPKTSTQRQNTALTSGKTNQINSAYQSNQQNSGS